MAVRGKSSSGKLETKYDPVVAFDKKLMMSDKMMHNFKVNYFLISYRFLNANFNSIHKISPKITKFIKNSEIQIKF